MKVIRTYVGMLLLLLIVGASTAMFAQLAKTELYVKTWEDRVEAVEYQEQQVSATLMSQQYCQRLLEAIKMLAVENGLLCEREAKLTQYVAIMEEENTKLKAALSESVDRLETAITETENLYETIDNLKYRIQCLEKALNAVESAQNRQDTAQ